MLHLSIVVPPKGSPLESQIYTGSLVLKVTTVGHYVHLRSLKEELSILEFIKEQTVKHFSDSAHAWRAWLDRGRTNGGKALPPSLVG